MPHAATSSVSIVIPTMNRHDALRRALGSVLAQIPPAGVALNCQIVDNSADSNAREIVEAFAQDAGFPLHYIAEPRPGVATARNAGVAAAKGDYIAFLDDDEEAPVDWIARMLACATEEEADAVFGPVHARAEGGSELGPFARYFSRRFELPDRADLTAHAAYLGTNNSMFLRSACLSLPVPFDESLNRSGGEDSLLLKKLVEQGRRFAWCADAPVIEWVPPRRLDWSYVRRRQFLSGQIRSFVLAMLDRPRPLQIAFWMLAGTVQAIVYGLASVLLRALDATRAEAFRAKAYGGLGKLVWMKRFRPGLYGSGLVS